MSEKLPSPYSAWLPDWFVKLRHIPGAVTAIARLVRGAGRAGEAWIDVATAKGEQRAQAVRDQTTAHSELSKEAVMLAAKQMNKDPDLGARAVDHVMAGFVQKQENREAIALKTIEHLQEDPPEAPVAEPPSEDWMNVFEAHAEKASSEKLQEHWARILAGEIRKPGSISLLTLQFMSVLDKHLADVVQRTCAYVVDGNFVFLPDYNDDQNKIIDVVTLESLGFLRTGMQKNYSFNEDGIAIVYFGTWGLAVYRGRNKGAKDVVLKGAYLTRVGQEVMSIVPPQVDHAKLVVLAKQFAKSGFHVKVVNNVQVDGVAFKADVLSEHGPTS